MAVATAVAGATGHLFIGLLLVILSAVPGLLHGARAQATRSIAPSAAAAAPPAGAARAGGGGGGRRPSGGGRRTATPAGGAVGSAARPRIVGLATKPRTGGVAATAPGPNPSGHRRPVGRG